MKNVKFLLLILLYTSYLSDINCQVGQLQVGDAFQLEEIKTMSGETYNLEIITDKVFVMNFWNIGCRGCELERPFLNDLSAKYKDKDIVFWSITLNKRENMTSFLSKHPIDWEIKGDIDFMGLQGDDTFSIKCMPTTIVVDKQRRIVYSACGAILDDEKGESFQELLDVALVKK